MAFEIPKERKDYSISYVRTINYLPGKKSSLIITALNLISEINSSSCKGLDVYNENYKHTNKWIENKNGFFYNLGDD